MKFRSVSVQNVLFYITHFFFLLYAFFGTIERYESFLKFLTYISMISIFASFIISFNKYKRKELLILFVLISLSLIFAIKTNNFVMLKLILILIVCSGTAFDKRIAYDIKLRIIFTIFLFYLTSIGVARDVIFLYKDRVRHSLGFLNPNALGLNILIICFEIIYLKKDCIKPKHILMCLLLMTTTFLIDGSRTALYLLLGYLIFTCLCISKCKIYENKIFQNLICNLPLILLILICIIFVLYVNGNSYAMKIDEILSGRLLNMKYFFDNYDINLFGNNIALANKSCDTAVIYVLYAFGISGLLMYIVGIKKLLKELFERKDFILVTITFMFVIYGLSEKLWLFADFNIMISSFTFLFFDKPKKEICYEEPKN